MHDNWLTGIHAVHAALTHDPTRVLEVLIESGTRNRRTRELADQARASAIQVTGCPAAALEALSPGRPHQGVAARCLPPELLAEAGLLERVRRAGATALVLVLDQVQDPGNLGACLRTAAAAGVTAAVIPKHRAAPLTPVARKAAAGATEVLPIAAVSNLRRTLEQLKQAGLWAVGAAGQAEATLWQADLTGPTVLVLGGEQKGLRRLTREACDQLVRIPMRGAVESLNVSVACGICLFEVLRQRQRKC